MALVTVTADFARADETPADGWVLLAPVLDVVRASPDLELITRARLRGQLDAAGSWTADVIASDDPGWLADGPVPYWFQWTVSGSYNARQVVILGPGPVDLLSLVDLADPTVTPTPVPGPVGPAPALVDGTTTTLPPATPATSDVVPTGTDGEYRLDFGIPSGLKGDKGDRGDQGLQGEVTVASTATGAPGTSATVTDSDASPNRAALVFTIPRGDVGATGPAIGAILTTKGDLAVRDAATAVRLGVGTAGQVLQVDSATATGLKWATSYTVTRPNTDDVLVTVGGQTVHYDSGWRSLPLINGWTAAGGYLRIRRVDDRVSLVGFGMTGAAATADAFANTPAGFRQAFPSNACIATSNFNGTFTYIGVMTANAFNSPLRATLYFEISYAADPALPASLPGTLVSAAPA